MKIPRTRTRMKILFFLKDKWLLECRPSDKRRRRMPP
jgi:hypothetical protein